MEQAQIDAFKDIFRHSAMHHLEEETKYVTVLFTEKALADSKVAEWKKLKENNMIKSIDRYEIVDGPHMVNMSFEDTVLNELLKDGAFKAILQQVDKREIMETRVHVYRQQMEGKPAEEPSPSYLDVILRRDYESLENEVYYQVLEHIEQKKMDDIYGDITKN